MLALFCSSSVFKCFFWIFIPQTITLVCRFLSNVRSLNAVNLVCGRVPLVVFYRLHPIFFLTRDSIGKSWFTHSTRKGHKGTVYLKKLIFRHTSYRAPQSLGRIKRHISTIILVLGGFNMNFFFFSRRRISRNKRRVGVTSVVGKAHSVKWLLDNILYRSSSYRQWRSTITQ